MRPGSTRVSIWMTATALCAGCGGDHNARSIDAPSIDGAAGPPTVVAAMAARGPWMEDFAWTASAYKPCTGCEHLTTLEISAGHYQFGVFQRPAGQPAMAATPVCSVRFDYVESP